MTCTSDIQCTERLYSPSNPVSKRCPWTKEEDKLLVELIPKYGNQWNKIASKIKGRTIRQCRARWHNTLNPSVTKGPWTEEEDRLLVELIPEYGNQWNKIASKIKGRTCHQCRARWHNTLDPSVKRGPWTEEEDRLLSELYSKYGKKWHFIASKIKRRTDQQCRLRWHHTLDPSVKKGIWTGREDRLLVILYSKYGNKWNVIASKMHGRTDQQCRQRWQTILYPSVTKGSWTEKAGRLLSKLYTKESDEWKKIMSEMVDIIGKQGGEKRHHKPFPGVNKVCRTEEKNDLLVNLNSKSDDSWNDIVTEITGSSNIQCRESLFKNCVRTFVEEKKKNSRIIGKLNINGRLCTGYLTKSTLTSPVQTHSATSIEPIITYDIFEEDELSNLGESTKCGVYFNVDCKIVLLEPFATQSIAEKTVMMILQNYHNDLLSYDVSSKMDGAHQMDLMEFIATLKAA